jgi:membrane fusion protein (multidrug efflux system)
MGTACFRHVGALAFCLTLVLPVAAQSPVPPAGAPRPAAPAAPVAVRPVTPADDASAIRVLLSADQETTLAAQMVGRIASLPVQLGKRMKKGQTVASFDCGEANARLNMAQAEYAAAKESLNAKERLRSLDAAGDVEVSLAAASADRGKAAIALSRAQLSPCSVVAPFTGSVVKIHVKQHQGVSIGAPLVEMISDGPLKLRLNVPSRWLRQLKVGTPFEVAINETGLSYPAKVTLINARVDAVAQTIELEARMDSTAPDLLAGMSGTARFRMEP